MLDSGASANIMPLKVMKQLNLSITRKYKAICGFNSQPIKVEGLIKDLKVSLAMNLNISLLMDVVVIDILDVWRMLLARRWAAIMGGLLQMDLSYVTIPQSDGTPFTLYREPMYPTHVVKPGPIPYYKIPEIEQPSLILPCQEFHILKSANHKQNKKWKPKKENKVGDVVLVDKNPIPVKIHGKVGEDYYYIAKLDSELWPQPVKLSRITPFLDN